MRRWTPVFVIVAMLALTGVATNYFYAIEVKTTLTASDLDIGDDVDITGDLNVDGITTLDDTTVDGPFEVNGATTLDVDTTFYDASQDPDAIVALVTVDPDTDAGQFISTGSMLAIDDPSSPGSIAGVGVIGPIADRTTNTAPRLELKSPSGVYLDMYADDHTVTMDIYDTASDSTLVIENPDGTRQGNLAVENLITTRLANIGGGYGSVGTSIDGSGNVSTNGSLIVDGKRRATPDNNTIASGSIAYESEYQRTDTEGAASTDDLVTVTGGTDGDVMFLRSTSAARDIVLKHGTGADRLTLRDNADFTLDTSFDIVGFVRGTTSWFEIFRTDSGGSGTPAASGTYTPTVTSVGGLSSVTVPSGGWNYLRVGSSVTVSGMFSATTSAGFISWRATLPIASNFSSTVNQCVGTMHIQNSYEISPGVNFIAEVPGAILPDSTNDAAYGTTQIANAGTGTFHVHFTYRIL